MDKLNETSYQLLLNASEKLDPETLNFDYGGGDENIFYCIWANISHNPKWDGLNKKFNKIEKPFL